MFRRFSLNGVLARLWRSFGRSKRSSPTGQVLLRRGWEYTKGTPEGARETKKAQEERKRAQERPKESHKCPRDTKRRENEAPEERKRTQKRLLRLKRAPLSRPRSVSSSKRTLKGIDLRLSSHKSPRIPERAFFDISDVLFCAQESHNS